MKDDFATAADTEYAPVNFIWGLDSIDRKASNFNRYVPDKQRGVPTYDAKFDIYDKTTQTQILAACNQNTGTITTFECDLDPGCYAGKASPARARANPRLTPPTTHPSPESQVAACDIKHYK